MAKLEDAKNAYKTDPKNADNIIWYGRRMAYAGNYRGAIRIYTEGLRKFPDDARFYGRGNMPKQIQEYCTRTGQSVPGTKGRGGLR